MSLVWKEQASCLVCKLNSHILRYVGYGAVK
jgi:hypothetical protein